MLKNLRIILQKPIGHHLQLIDILSAVVFAIFSWWLMDKSFQYQDEQFVILGKVWSDFAAHIPLIRSFSMGNNFPPEYPTFPGEPIRYHYLFFLIVGMMEKIGLNIAFALNLMSAFGMFLLLEMIYLYGWKFFDSRKIGFLAVVLFLFNGTFSVWEFIKTSDSVLELLNQIITAKEYASFGPWDGHIVSAFWNWNIYINQRHLAMSYGLALLGMFPLLIYSKVNQKKSIFQKINEFLKDKLQIVSTKFEKIMDLKNRQSKGSLSESPEPKIQKPKTTVHIPHSTFLNNFTTDNSKLTTTHSLSPFTYYLFPLFLIFPLLHQASWVMLCGFSVFWICTHFLVLPKKLVIFYFFSMIASVLVANFFTQADNQPVIFQLGYLSNAKNLPDFLWYWLMNLGAYFLLIPVIFIFAKKQTKLFLIPLTIFFILANLYKLSPDMINNHKLLNFVIIGFNLVVAEALVKLVQKSKFLLIFILPLFLILTISGISDVFPLLNNHYHYIDDYQKNETANWVKTHSLPRSIFLTNSYLYNPAQLVGRKTFLDYGYFNWSMGYADGQRRELLSQIFSPSDTISGICKLLAKENIDYILIDPAKGDPHPGVIFKESVIFQNFSPIFESEDGWTAYDSRLECLPYLPTITTQMK